MLFLPYIEVGLPRRNGPHFMTTWYIPLYFSGVQAFREDVLTFSPAGSPFRQCMDPADLTPYKHVLPFSIVVPFFVLLISIPVGAFIAYLCAQFGF